MLADFGLSKLLDDVAHHHPELAPSDTTTSHDHGNLRWLAPEFVNCMFTSSDPPTRSKETDIYALGVTIIEVGYPKQRYHGSAD